MKLSPGFVLRGLMLSLPHRKPEFGKLLDKLTMRPAALSQARPSHTIPFVVNTQAQPSSVQQVTLGLIQMSCTDRPQDNLDKAVHHIQSAARKGAQIICLQELFRTQYFCQSEDVERFQLAEAIPSPTTERLSRLAADHQVVLIVPVFEKRAEGVFHNTAVVIDADGSLIGKYRKMHIPDDPLYYEKFYFTPGDLGFPTFQTRYARVGVLICWDQWFPEAARLTALNGAQILFYPTALGGHPADDTQEHQLQQDAWQTVQRGHAITNGVYIAAVNRVGQEGELNFWGTSFVSDPFGRVLKQAGADGAQTLIVPCDLTAIQTTRQYWPFLRDRRVDAYGDLNRRYID